MSSHGILNAPKQHADRAFTQVCFLTSPLRGAGTDSTVSFELQGDRGTSGPITVAAGKEAFERGSNDMFAYSRPWLGQLQQLVVWHDNAGAAAGRGPWHLEAVVVSCSRDQQVRGKLHRCAADHRPVQPVNCGMPQVKKT